MPPHAHIRLVELNSFVKKLIADNTQPQWITAEISEVNEHYSGHCYLELIEKDDADEHIIAKAKAAVAELVVFSDLQELLSQAQLPLPIPQDVPEWLSPVISVIPGQILAWQMALSRGLDPDKPKGLSKVTETL